MRSRSSITAVVFGSESASALAHEGRGWPPPLSTGGNFRQQSSSLNWANGGSPSPFDAASAKAGRHKTSVGKSVIKLMFPAIACSSKYFVWHQESCVTGVDEAGACGISRLCEQARREQGRSRPGLDERDLASSAPDSSRAPSRPSELTEAWPANEVTPWPQPAEASVVPNVTNASGTRSAAASDCLARWRDEQVILTRDAGGTDLQAATKE